MTKYHFVLSEEAFYFLSQVSKADRVRLVGTFEALAGNPFAEPDGIIQSAARSYSARTGGRYMIIYWVDHAVAEVRIIDILRGE